MTKKNRLFVLMNLLLVLMLVVSGCSKQNTDGSKQQEEVPTIRMAWGFDLHTGLILAAAARGEGFKDTGLYLKPVVEKEKYELIENGKKIAKLQLIATKGSSESAVMLGQNKLDCCSNSITGMMAARDQGTSVKVLCPVHTDGIAIVFPKDSGIKDWGDIKNYIEKSPTPVKIGYHSPTSAPRVVIEKVLLQQGFKVTENPNDSNTDVLLVDLKGTGNLIGSLAGKQVDAWVGPSVYPETAEIKGLGSIVCNLEDFPPEGEWNDFACCVFAARQDSLEKNPEVYKAMVRLLSNTSKWCNENKKEAARLHADMIGIPVEAVEMSSLVFTTKPTPKWENAVSIYVDVLNDMNKFEGDMKGKSFAEVKQDMFDFRFINEINT